MGLEVINTVRTIEDLGISQHKDFRENRIIKKTKGLRDPITKNKLPLFKSTNTRGQSSSRTEFKGLKVKVRLFSQMYISTQIRGVDMDQFFSHETLKYPPALTKCGEMRSGEKSDLLKYLQLTPPQSHLGNVSAAALEGSVLVNMIKPKKNKTFGDYCSEMLIPQLQKYTREYDAQRIEVVFDTYKQVSLKLSARGKTWQRHPA